ncbi:MAG: hypothetical protein KGO47_07970 [Cyanobacteria bacterium REEB417]|jgi:hypothetical protein|nr:hypothetical protein [Cyanobacteria bacterium REEB417]
MSTRNGLISLAVLLLCGGILVLFTDIEVSAVRWVNCKAWATPSERSSELCR